MIRDLLFGAGLVLLCISLGHWSWPLAGAVCGLTMMLVAAWPYLLPDRPEQ